MSSTVVGNLSVELGLSDEQFKQALAHASVQAETAARNMQNKLSNITSGQGQNRSFTGLALNVSRAADDAQYGFRGIVNNMELIGMEAGKAFGLSTKAAMGLGAAATLAAVALNMALPALEKMSDTRTEMEKLATSPTAFASSIMMATRAIGTMQKEASTLLSKDATSGFGAFLERQIEYLAEWNNKVAGSETVFSRFARSLGLAKTMEQQIQGNRDAGRAANRLIIDSKISGVQASRDQSAFDKGASLIGEERMSANRDVSIDNNLKNVFADATKGQLELIKVEFTRNMVRGGMGADEAEQEALKLIGEASEGMKSAATKLGETVKSFDLAGSIEKFREQRLDQSRFQEYERAVSSQDSLIERRDKMVESRKRSEIVGAADVFARNLNAGQKSPELEELEKINGSIKELGSLTGILN